MNAAGGVQLNRELLDATLRAVGEVETVAQEKGITLGATTACALLGQRGILDGGGCSQDPSAILAEIEPFIPGLFSSLVQERQREGTALRDILSNQLTQVSELTAAAAATAEARCARAGEVLKQRVNTLMEAQSTIDADRIAQELALLAVKSDVTEEIDRLRAHVNSARALLDGGEPAGRKLDFMMQEFNREANTLCSKAQDVALTGLGLELKVVIDQMREQCQNLE